MGQEPSNGYIAIGDAIKLSYRIPKYQRGYRWTVEHVEKLLDDIYEDRLYINGSALNENNAYKQFWSIAFNEDEDGNYETPKSPYCIQPLVVMKTKNENYYDVIDGQQRLTTISIIRAALNKIGGLGIIPSNLSYESRTHSQQYIEYLYTANNKPQGDNIDFDYMSQAYDVAKKYYTGLLEGKFTSDEIKKKYASYLDDVICKNTQFIWYQVESGDPQKVFANFNTGKIELTNAELIKALFMNPANYNSENIKDKQIVISEKWDEIENKLHEPDFWAFVPHRNQYNVENSEYNTRIDIFFDFLILNNWLSENKDSTIDGYIKYRNKKLSNRYIFNEIDTWITGKSLNSNSKDETMDKCWSEIQKVFSGLKELYSTDGRGEQNSKIYNLAGLYVNLRNRSDYNVDGYIDSSDEYLKIYFELNNILQMPRDKREAGLTELIKTCFSLNNNIEGSIKKIRYNDSKHSEIVKILLTYNIALLTNSGGIGERFNFLANAKNKWQREHIFASNMDETKCEVISKERDGERKAALKILSENEYVDYIKYLFDIKEPIEFTYEGIAQTLDENDENSVQNFINANIAYDGNGQNELLARAIKAKSDTVTLLERYAKIDEIDRILNQTDNDKQYLVEKYVRDNLTDFSKRSWLRISVIPDVENKIKKIAKGCKDIDFNDKLKWTYSIPNDIVDEIQNATDINSWLSTQLSADSLKTNFNDLLDKIQTSYQGSIETIIFKKSKDSNGKETKSYDDNWLNDKDKYSTIESALSLNKDTFNAEINEFFNKNFAELLKDNSMGNMTLLTGGQGGSQNQVVSNKPYCEKRKIITECFKKGQFVPLGTLFVFTDLYTNGISTANFWLPDSRKKYIEDMVKTLKKFFGEKEEGNQNG